ncbi:hypothetical protein BH24DEI2_BH24DEI2_09060 [soil metagenome]
MLEIRDERQLKALIGLSEDKFETLTAEFAKVYQAGQQQAYDQAKGQGKRHRKPGGGQKGKLPEASDKLMFVLYYFKNYPTFDVLGTQFGIARSKACENLHKLTPVLHETLAELGVLPQRKFESVEAFKTAVGEIDKLLIDATERPSRRPSKDERQRELYSGKKSVTP